MHKKRFLILSGLFVVLVALSFVFSQDLLAANPASGNYGLDATANSAGLPMNKDLPGVIGNILGSALSLISVLFFGLMIYGGITWMLARGKSENTQKALDTIIAAVIGIVVVLAAYAITNFVFSNVISGAGGATTSNNGGAGGSSPGGVGGAGGTTAPITPTTVTAVGASCSSNAGCTGSGQLCNSGSCAIAECNAEQPCTGGEKMCDTDITWKCVTQSCSSSIDCPSGYSCPAGGGNCFSVEF